MNEDLGSVPTNGMSGRALLQGGLSVFFPAFNDALFPSARLNRTFAILPRVSDDYEVIAINDGSTDGTAAVLEQLHQRYTPRLRVITYPENLGYGGALRSGFAAATKAFVFYTDGDGQYDPTEIKRLAQAWSFGTCLVKGYKFERQDPGVASPSVGSPLILPAPSCSPAIVCLWGASLAQRSCQRATMYWPTSPLRRG